MAFVDEASHYCRIRSPTSTSPSGDGSTETDSGSTASLPSSQPIIGAEALFGEIIKLSIWEHLSNGEIATVLGIEPNAVRQRLHRAKKRLAQEFEKHQKQITASPAAQEGGEW